MEMKKAAWFAFPLLLGLGAWMAFPQAPAGRTLVLDDFEFAGAAARWEGPVEISTEHASHGRQSLKVSLDRDRPQFSSAKLPADWSGHDRLRFDIYCESAGMPTATL